MVARTLKEKLPWLHQMLSPEQLTVALRSFKVFEFSKGDTLMVVDPKIPQEDRGKYINFFVLQKGQVECVRVMENQGSLSTRSNDGCASCELSL